MSDGNREMLVFMKAVQKWSMYLRRRELNFRTDHFPSNIYSLNEVCQKENFDC